MSLKCLEMREPVGEERVYSTDDQRRGAAGGCGEGCKRCLGKERRRRFDIEGKCQDGAGERGGETLREGRNCDQKETDRPPQHRGEEQTQKEIENIK